MKVNDNEDEYFARQEIERKKQWEAERAQKMASADKDRLKELHHMKCPKCGMDLHTIDYRGIAIDRCVSCNGTWFDAGELDQLLGHDEGFLGKMKTFFA